MNIKDLQFRRAKKEEQETIFELYQDARKEPFCVWDDEYPSIEGIKEDLANDNLYVLTKESLIVAAISIINENELDTFSCWQVNNQTQKEIARIVVKKEYQGYSLAYLMVNNISIILKERGFKAIHLSVEVNNIPAYKTYLKAGFKQVGKTYMYDHDYYLMEKTI